MNTMGYNTIVLAVFAFAVVHFTVSELRQERAMIECNPKFASDCHALTRRTGRGKSYSTNITGTTLYLYSNNATIHIYVSTLLNQNLFHLQYKWCEFIKQKWALEFINTYSDVPAICPLPVGTYGAYNLVLPPKNFPIPVPIGDLRTHVTFIFNPTNEMMANISAILRQ